MSNKIKISIPPKQGEIDAAQDTLSLHAENGHAGKLDAAESVLRKKAEQLERVGHHHDASKVAALASLAMGAAQDVRDSR
jgi:hypothetical protein